MKNKKTLMILALAVTLSGVLSACSFGGDEPKEIVEATPHQNPQRRRILLLHLQRLHSRPHIHLLIDPFL